MNIKNSEIVRTIATIGIQLHNGETFTNYMIVDVDPTDGTWVNTEQDCLNNPFVYSRLSDAEQSLGAML